MSSQCIGVGIDTARYGHHVSFLDADLRTAAKAFHFKEDRSGYHKLLETIEKIRAKHPDAAIYVRIDTAGRYAENLIQWLCEQNIPHLTISVGKPAQNKAYREVHYDKSKADPIESQACARFAVKERPQPMEILPKQLVTLRNAVSAMEAIATDHTRLINQLHALLANSFPELTAHVTDISKVYCLTLLAKYPTASKLAAARVETLLKIPYLKEELARTLHQVAKNSTASVVDPTQELLIQAKVDEIFACQKRQTRLQQILQQAWDNLPDGPAKRILTIPGVGIQTAAALVAKIVSVERFATDKQLVGYFGIFPSQHDSGTTPAGNAKSNSNGKMCPKGNDLVRRLLFTAAQVAVTHNPAIRALFARQMQLSKPYMVALGHCMAKILRQVHAVWRKDEDFDPTCEITEQQSAENATLAGNAQYHWKETATPTDAGRETQTPIKMAVGPSDTVVKPQWSEVTTAVDTINAQASSGKRPPLNYTLLKSQIEILQVLRSYDWQERTRRGSQLRGACPIHSSQPQDRSFAVNANKQTFCCHSCGCRGNALDLLVVLSKLPLHEAAWKWIDRTCITPPILEGQPKKPR